jgi:hypothetical protein
MNGKLEYEYFRLQKLEKMLESYLWHVRIIYFGETNFDANGKCIQDEKGQDIPIGWCYQADRKIL